ncbi:CRISPR-associated protein Csx11 [Deferribacter thermophilus]|uniref:CRISPR-associated protein Csx11 n=1 Tax=Deferribacter thermophilus TaxID=53573 RepID=UPI003C1D2D6E
MLGLDLNKLKQYRNEILKAEIVSYLALWDKLNPSDQNKASINIQCNDLNCWESTLKDREIDIKLDVNSSKSFKLWDNFLNNLRDWRKQNSLDFLLQILYGISESLNSGIDKGSPKDDVKVKPENERWLANAFGSYKEDIIYLENDENKINNLINDIQNNIQHLLDKSNISFGELEELRKELKELLSGLLSDDRFPINDVSLWEQTYLPASMFKALLSDYILINQNFKSIPDRQKVKWRILGVQYDKLGLAEKGLKLASIEWYRETAKEIDNEIKELLEIKHPIGNEIYRDETGIYFIVGENIGQDGSNGLACLKGDLKSIEERIISIFKEKLEGEIYPTIVLTKASRGLMNLGYLLEKAKESFLKIKINDDITKTLIQNINNTSEAIGICPLCKIRLIYKEDKEKNNSTAICKTCDERIHHYSVKNWIQNLGSETIWVGEIKDKNDRIALVSLKFELKDWLNGNLLNSLLVREEDYNDYFETIKHILKEIQKIDWNNFENFFTNEESNIKKFLKLFDKKGIQIPYSSLLKDSNLKTILTQRENNLDERKKSLKDLFYRSLENYLLPFFGKPLEDWLAKISNNFQQDYIFEEKRFKNQQIFKNNIEFLKSSFSMGFVLMQIYNTLLERSIGNEWEKFIKNNLSNKNHIDFENRMIDWQKLTDNDIEFLATLLLQFLLRKNPSPARLRRIWETTQEFFENIKIQVLENNQLGIPEWRRKRIVFEADLQELNKSREITDEKGLLYWAEKNANKIYLISSIEDFLDAYNLDFYNNKKLLKELKNSKTNFEKTEEINSQLNQIIESLKNNSNPINIKFYTYNEKENKEDKPLEEINIKSIEIISYKPYASITDPTPAGWQVIIPAEYVSRFIDLVMEKYNQEFKYVYGKLSIHIGIVVQNYKKPLYIGINALRRIRRDVKDTDKLGIKKDKKEFKKYFRYKTIYYAKQQERENDTANYYSLYWNNTDQKDYNFFIKPNDNWKKWISVIGKFPNDSSIEVVPNTFDFEFLDNNTRRNDIFYDEEKGYKRAFELKANRPYEIEEYWKKFKAFKELFKEKTNAAKMHKLVSLFYEKLQNYEKDLNPFLASAIINILELRKNKEAQKHIQNIFGLNKNKDIFEELKDKLNKEKIKLFIDMFEFWHTALKEV